MDASVRLMKGFLYVVLIDIAFFASSVLSDYCLYRDDKDNAVRNKYCEHGCCKDRGDKGDICCFNWSIGIIIGICLACVAVLTTIIIVIICCYVANRKRKRFRAITINNTQSPSSSVVYTASAYIIPHPPSAFYPTSKFPNTPPAVPPTPPPLYDEVGSSEQTQSLFTGQQFRFPAYPSTTKTNYSNG